MSRRRPSYVIVFVRLGHASDPKDLRTWREIQPHEISGYDADDFPPGFRDLKFPSSRDAGSGSKTTPPAPTFATLALDSASSKSTDRTVVGAPANVGRKSLA